MPYPQIPDSYIRQAVIQGINFRSHEQWFAWILSSHYDFSEKVQTEIGELVSKAKYKDDASAVLRLRTIVRHAVLQLRKMPNDNFAFSKIDVVLAVPYFYPKDISLPHVAGKEISEALSIPDCSSFIRKRVDTSKAKLTPAVNPAAYEILRSLDGLNVLIVDDLFHTGSTLESVAIKVREAGAKSVTGFCLTKVNKGLN
jgi:predicted amidophosphoribosyltransferase